jgi:hypothetical protein
MSIFSKTTKFEGTPFEEYEIYTFEPTPELTAYQLALILNMNYNCYGNIIVAPADKNSDLFKLIEPCLQYKRQGRYDDFYV